MPSNADTAGNVVVPLLVAGMMFSGVCSTLLMKYQTLTMFIGESGCWLLVLGTFLTSRRRVYQPVNSEERAGEETTNAVTEDADEDTEISSGMTSSQTLVDPTNAIAKPLIDGQEIGGVERQKLRGFKITLLALPAICDILGTTLMNVGLLFVAASIYQMTRGALVLFVGLFSVLFLKRHLTAWKWASLFIVVLGVAIVGLAGVIEDKEPQGHDLRADPTSHDLLRRFAQVAQDELSALASHTAAETVLGIFLIASAQVFAAGQFVVEESIMERFSMDPVQVVGWEGVFGFIITLAAMGILHAAIGQTDAGQGGYFDARAGFTQLFTHWQLQWSMILSMFAIAGLNTFGLAITRTISATSRSTIDTCRTLLIWLVSLGLGGASFKWVQVLGFAILVWGTAIFNDIVQPPTIAWWRRKTGAGTGRIFLDHDEPRRD